VTTKDARWTDEPGRSSVVPTDQIARVARWTDEPGRSSVVPTDQIARVALGLLLQARMFAQNAGTDFWDFALEINRLFESGLTISDLRWLVAKGFAEHGQELSEYGAPHRSFRRGDGFFFDHTTCVVLTPSGAAFVDHVLRAPVAPRRSAAIIGVASIAGESSVLENGTPRSIELEQTTALALKPRWDSTLRELSLDGLVVKRFRVPALNQEMILSAFQEDNWSECIDDPLPVKGDIDPRTRLHDAINRLNRCQTNPLLCFHGNGSGTGVRWMLRRAVALHRRCGSATVNNSIPDEVRIVAFPSKGRGLLSWKP
jgi:hypothetical protein